MDRFIRDELVAWLYSADVQLITAGCDRLHWCDTGFDPDDLEQHLLGGLSRIDGADYLRRWHISEPRLVEALLDAASYVPEGAGQRAIHPFFLYLVAKTVDNHRKEGRPDPAPETFDGGPDDRTAERLADRFLKSLPSDGSWKSWVRSLSLPPWFDRESALALAEEYRVPGDWPAFDSRRHI